MKVYRIMFKGEFLGQQGTKAAVERRIDKFRKCYLSATPADFRVYDEVRRYSLDENFQMIDASWVDFK